MIPYCFKCRKNREIKSPRVTPTTNRKIVLLLKCAIAKNQGLSKSKKKANCGNTITG